MRKVNWPKLTVADTLWGDSLVLMFLCSPLLLKVESTCNLLQTNRKWWMRQNVTPVIMLCYPRTHLDSRPSREPPPWLHEQGDHSYLKCQRPLRVECSVWVHPHSDSGAHLFPLIHQVITPQFFGCCWFPQSHFWFVFLEENTFTPKSPNFIVNFFLVLWVCYWACMCAHIDQLHPDVQKTTYTWPYKTTN